ncbi:OmpA family protein [Ehrlichia ruminantium]|uniref:OmpA family protein n=1 Tax=Ehrlichia ruminantium TaxID=779 RepID=A0AAE6QBI6_EHRRU|nr:OmpA family protein [Ehrlichia ruminantium]QGR02626.1 OmpA family protein [Ehrlichia ruminantium]QGR03546.1 OmpA family protein [Ehrlichia ruminantium]QGR04473.1 OmpA family protein [Ehrlichia ruminantium]
MRYQLIVINLILLCLTLSGCHFNSKHVPLVNAHNLFSNIKAIDKVYFDLDKAIIKDSDKVLLEKLVQKAQNDPTADIIIVGHTDARGTDEYNLALGEERANAVKDFIISCDKSLESRITVRSKGKSEPAILVYSNNPKEAEDAHAKNRRVVITLVNHNASTSNDKESATATPFNEEAHAISNQEQESTANTKVKDTGNINTQKQNKQPLN